MDKINNIHDKLLLESLSEKGVADDFLRNSLPLEVSRHICLESLDFFKDGFVNLKLKELCPEVYYEVLFSDNQPGFGCFLFEYTSSPNRFVALQALRCLLEIWELHQKLGPAPWQGGHDHDSRRAITAGRRKASMQQSAPSASRTTEAAATA